MTFDEAYKLPECAKLDSWDKKVNVWPSVLYNHGAWYAYIRIKRHDKYWLVLQQQFAIGNADALISALEQFHMNAYKLFHCFIVDWRNPFLKTGDNQPHPAFYLDINQESEVNILTKHDNL